MPLKLLPSFACVLLLVLFGAAFGADELKIYFKTTPGVKLLRPFREPADLVVLVTGADGRPVEQGSVDIRLDAPEPGPVFSTDFPLVEGTRLSEMRLPLRRGQASWKMLLPIRGEYRLSVDVAARDGRRASKRFTFMIRENEKKWLALAGFSLGLFLLGFVAGRIFTGSRSAAAVLAALVLLSSPVKSGGAQENEGEGKAVLEIEPATVGKLSLVRWSRETETASVSSPALLTLIIEHLEKNKIAFAIDRIPVAREFSMRFHFTDGARYRVTTLAQIPGEAPLRNERVVDVTGVEPPARAMVPALVFFLSLIALGLGVGRWSKRHKSAA